MTRVADGRLLTAEVSHSLGGELYKAKAGKIAIPCLRAGTRCAVLRGSLCVYLCIVLIYSAAKLQVCLQ